MITVLTKRYTPLNALLNCEGTLCLYKRELLKGLFFPP